MLHTGMSEVTQQCVAFSEIASDHSLCMGIMSGSRIASSYSKA